MKLIKPSFEILEQVTDVVPKMSKGQLQIQAELLDNMYKHIELCGRTCYKSTDKITEDSAKPFVERMIASKHYAMLEHGTVYLKIPNKIIDFYDEYGNDIPVYNADKYYPNKYSYVKRTRQYFYITTNYRVIIENGWENDLQYLCEPTEYHEKRHTVRFICNRQVSHEFVRHRVFSFAQESTRYCNYTKDKFGNELTFIEPCWDYESINSDSCPVIFGIEDPVFSEYLQIAENFYFDLIQAGWKPEQAATILPNALKTELIMTGFEEDWKHFFDLRADGTTGKPHPQAQELALPLKEKFIENGWYRRF